MKLYLHWLWHDLRRFRLMFGIWTLLTALYACFLGWAHLHILTVRQDTLDWSKPAAIALGLLQCGFLFALFNSDPATGTRHFWKTRPPSGLTIAGVKLTLAVGFFLILPLAVWRLMNLLSVLPQYVTAKSPGGQPWGAFLFWILSLVLAAFVFAAASASDGRVLYLRLLAVLGVPAAFLILLSRFAPMEWDWKLQRLRANRNTERELYNPEGAGACLGSGVVLFLALRHTRLPVHGLLPAMVIPTASLILFNALRPKPEVLPADESLPPADSTFTGKLKLTNSLYYPMLSGPGSTGPVEPDFKEGYIAPDDFTGKHSTLAFDIRISGVPEVCRTSGRWLDLTLTLPDGTAIQADRDKSRKLLNRGGIINHSAGPRVNLNGAVFPTAGLRPFYGQICTAAGTVRLTVYELRKMEMPVPADRYGGPDLNPFASTSPASPPVATFFSGGTLGRNYLSATWLMAGHRNPDVFLENTASGENESLGTSSYPTTGFLINYQAMDSFATLDGGRVVEGGRSQGRKSLPATIRKFSAPGSAWKAGLRWYQPVSIADIPVTLHDVSIPFRGAGQKKPAKEFSQLRIAPGSSTQEVRSALMRAWFLYCESAYATYSYGRGYIPPEGARRADEEWRRILAEVQHQNLSLLVDLVDELSEEPGSGSGGTRAFKQRIRELIQPDDVPAILQQFPKATINLLDVLPPPTAPSLTEPAPPAPAADAPPAPGK